MQDNAVGTPSKKRLSTKHIVMVSAAVLILLIGVGVWLICRQVSHWANNPYYVIDGGRVFRQVMGWDTDNLQDIEKNRTTFATGLSHFMNGLLADSERKPEKAIRFYKDALDQFEAYPGWNNMYAYDCLQRLADDLTTLQMYDEAEKYYKSAIDCAEKASSKKSYVVALAWRDLGFFYDHRGRLNDALNAFQNQVAIDQPGLGEKNKVLESAYWWIAAEQFKLRDYADADASYAHAVRIAIATGDDKHIGQLNYERGRTIYELKNYEGSIFCLNEAFKNLPPTSPDKYEAQLGVANDYVGEKKQEKANQAIKLAIPSVNSGFNALNGCRLYGDLSDYFLGQKDYAQAEKMMRLSLNAAMHKTGTMHDMAVMYAQSRLANCLLKENHTQDAASMFAQVLQSSKKTKLWPPRWVRVEAAQVFTANHQPALAKEVDALARQLSLKHASEPDDFNLSDD